MKKLSPSLIMLAVLGLSQGAQAANWLELQGNEPANAPTFKLWGFLQPTYTYNKADKISGLTGAPNTPYNGHYIIPNLVGPDSTDKQAFQFNRARLGVRGVLNPVDKRINYFVLLEAGKNAITREHSVVLSDASMTFNYIPGARIRVGLFKLPTGEEALVPVHTAYDYVYFSNVTDNLLNERTVRPVSPSGRPVAPLTTGIKAANIAGSISGFRDIGIQVYDWFGKGPWEFSYAGMVSNGNNINYLGDDNSSKDFTGRLQASYIFGGKGPKREDLSVFVWHQQGKRTFGSSDYDRVREGTGFTYRQKAIHFAGEYLRGKGMIFVGPQPPFNDLGGATTVQPLNTVALSDSNKADGWYLSGGYRFLKDWEFDLRYDTLDRLSNSPADERVFKTWTVGTQYFINKDTRLTLNYEFRKQEVTNPLAITNTTQRANAQTIADNLGDRISLQLTYLF